VFPHVSTVQFFALDRILKYKKGRVSSKRSALCIYRGLFLEGLRQREPALVIESLPEASTGGKALKELEDKLDAIACAYTAAHWWWWGRELHRGSPHLD
jgi:predicted RNase H-like nuclease